MCRNLLPLLVRSFVQCSSSWFSFPGIRKLDATTIVTKLVYRCLPYPLFFYSSASTIGCGGGLPSSVTCRCSFRSLFNMCTCLSGGRKVEPRSGITYSHPANQARYKEAITARCHHKVRRPHPTQFL